MADFPRLVYHATEHETLLVDSKDALEDALTAGYVLDPPLAIWYPHAVPAEDAPTTQDAPPHDDKKKKAKKA
jgi:hypothetical protein